MTLRTALLCAAVLTSTSVFAAEKGGTLKQVELQTFDGAAAQIPDLGKKVIALFYSDADVADMNDPLADALKAKEFDKSLYRGMGVANLQDSKAPNFLIRSIVKGKVEKYKSTILLDPSNALSSAWSLGDCNNQSVVVVIGPDQKVKFLKKGAVKGEDLVAVVKLVEELTNELKASGASATKAPEPAIAPGVPAVAPTP